MLGGVCAVCVCAHGCVFTCVQIHVCLFCVHVCICMCAACLYTHACVSACVRVCVPIQQVFTQPPGHRPVQISVDTQATTAYLDEPWPLSSWLHRVKPEMLAPREDRCRVQGRPLREFV